MLVKYAALSTPISPLYVDDVFSTYTYTGTGAAQTITNGIDLANKGGMVWSKRRDAVRNHNIGATALGTTGNNTLRSNTTDAAFGDGTQITAFNSNGYSLGIYGESNETGNFVSWTFRKATKFFDVITYIGDNTTNRSINHNLGITPGMIIVKDTTNGATSWFVWHRSLTNNNYYLLLHSTSSEVTGDNPWGGTATGVGPTSTTFTIGGINTNSIGSTYIAYIFAHDTNIDGVIQCGSYSGTGSAGVSVNLGWEPQFLLIKEASIGTSDWMILDTMRGLTGGNSNDANLQANTSNTETAIQNEVEIAATGFTRKIADTAGDTIIYIAIRRPNKPIISGTQIYNTIVRAGTDSTESITGIGFTPDLVLSKNKSAGFPYVFIDRLRGATLGIIGSSMDPEVTASTSLTSFGIDGYNVGADSTQLWINSTLAGAGLYTNYNFRRATEIFDTVCDVGTSSAKQVSHSLAVVPEFIIRKSRLNSGNWQIWHKDISGGAYLTTAIWSTGSGLWVNGTVNMNNSTFSVSGASEINSSSDTYVTYLFATKVGISKVGSYTGNGSSQTINCGFSGGARFILIKRTDVVGNWYNWDTVRGIIAGNDPYTTFNTTDAEITTDDSVDPDSSGFIVNQLGTTNINVTSATYIFLAFA